MFNFHWCNWRKPCPICKLNNEKQIKEIPMVSDGFGFAKLKQEGGKTSYDTQERVEERPSSNYVYVERRVPKELEQEAHRLLDVLLRQNGIIPEAY